MKGVKRRFANVRNIALFISIFMFISLFSNITVKADELENGEVNPVVSEQAELQSNEEFDTENELLIPEETTDYDDAQNDEVTSADLTGSGEELSEESKEELPTAEEANKQEEFFQEEILEDENILFNRGLNKDNVTNLKRLNANEKTVIAQMTLEKNLYIFHSIF